MNTTEFTPEIFNVKPWGSKFNKSEFETIAKNIMAILKRTGNTFRELSWKEYKEERLKDGSFSELEKEYFEKVSYLSVGNKEEILEFSDSWKEAYEKSEQIVK